MGLLKKDNWIVWLFLNVITQGFANLILAYFLGCYDKNAWYAKWQYWVFGAACLFFPVFIMLLVLMIQMEVKVCEKLEVSGKNIYGSPYSWLICLIVPIIGWALLIVMLIYIEIWPIVKLYQGKGEKYIK